MNPIQNYPHIIESLDCTQKMLAIMFLSSISSTLLTWSVSLTLPEENIVFNVFIIVKERGEIFMNCPNCLFGTKLLMCFDNHF